MIDQKKELSQEQQSLGTSSNPQICSWEEAVAANALTLLPSSLNKSPFTASSNKRIHWYMFIQEGFECWMAYLTDKEEVCLLYRDVIRKRFMKISCELGDKSCREYKAHLTKKVFLIMPIVGNIYLENYGREGFDQYQHTFHPQQIPPQLLDTMVYDKRNINRNILQVAKDPHNFTHRFMLDFKLAIQAHHEARKQNPTSNILYKHATFFPQPEPLRNGSTKTTKCYTKNQKIVTTQPPNLTR